MSKPKKKIIKNILPTDRIYLTDAQIETGRECQIDSGEGGYHRAEIIEITETHVTVETWPYWWFDEKSEQFSYPVFEATSNLFDLVEVNPFRSVKKEPKTDFENKVDRYLENQKSL